MHTYLNAYFISSSCFFCRLLIFFQNHLYSKNCFRNTIRGSKSLNQIRPDFLSGLIWFQTVCKSYQQTTLVGKELNNFFKKLSFWNTISVKDLGSGPTFYQAWLSLIYLQGCSSTSSERVNSLPTTIVVCCLLLQIHVVWTQIRPDKMPGLIWIQTV